MEVCTADGLKYFGILHAINTSKELEICLSMARLDEIIKSSKIMRSLIIKSKDIVKMTVCNFPIEESFESSVEESQSFSKENKSELDIKVA